jgi:solute carrier family 45 protein 1/2/4
LKAEEEDDDMASWAGQPSIKGSSETVRMALLTLSLVGLQFTWGIEMTCEHEVHCKLKLC